MTFLFITKTTAKETCTESLEPRIGAWNLELAAWNLELELLVLGTDPKY